ncbi:MAG: hypothetical protein IV107_00850 [Paucibacter sp.]|nr:hypothetical protein [Roseateles sp.]
MDKAGITLTVNSFVSITQGWMQTGGVNPAVTVQLDAGSSPRITLNNDSSLNVTGGDPTGSKGLALTITVVPALTKPVTPNFSVVGLIVKQTTGGASIANAWGSYSVGPGGNVLQVNDNAVVPGASGSVSYEFYVLIQTPSAPGSLGDFGLIDPRITNG